MKIVPRASHRRPSPYRPITHTQTLNNINSLTPKRPNPTHVAHDIRRTIAANQQLLHHINNPNINFFLGSQFFFIFTSMAAAADTTATTTPPSRPLPVREDCWSEEATATLVDAWGRRYLDLNRGNLRKKDWQEIADAVNSRHGHSKKKFRTDVQCKNRVDTVKKKYKIEKARVSSSNGALSSSWRFYDRLDELIGSNVSTKKSSVSPSMSPSPPLALPLPYRKNFTPVMLLPAASPDTILPQKRSAAPVDDSYFRRNYSTVTAAATDEDEADEMDDGDDDNNDNDDDSEGSRSSVERVGNGKSSVDGIRKLARAIERFGEIYERVEAEKQRQMLKLEKQRMQSAKDLEVQRMQMLMKTQGQLEKLKHSKGSGSNECSSLSVLLPSLLFGSH